MALISATDLAKVIDELTGVYRRMRGDTASGVSGVGIGLDASSGARSRLSSARAAVVAISADPDLVGELLGAFNVAVNTSLAPQALFLQACEPILQRIQANIQSNKPVETVNTLVDYLDYLNLGAGGDYACLIPPQFKDVLVAWGQTPKATDIYQTARQHEGDVDGLGRLVIGSGFTSSSAIDTAQFAGGAAHLRWTGCSGSGLVTVTASVRDTSGAILASKTYTHTVSTTQGTFYLPSGGGDPAPAGSLITACTNITAEAGLTNGTIIVEAEVPVNRVANLP